MPRGRKLTALQCKRLRQLLEAGVNTQQEIADAIHCSKETVVKHARLRLEQDEQHLSRKGRHGQANDVLIRSSDVPADRSL